MRHQHLGLAFLLGGGNLVAAQLLSSTPCITPTISICPTLQTIYVQQTITATNTVSAGYVTVTSVYRGASPLSPAPSTTTLVQPNGAAPGTVEIFYTPSTVTLTTLDTVTAPLTVTVSEQAGSAPGLVNITVPAYATTTLLDNGDTTRTSTIRQPAGTSPGLVEVLLPGYVTITTLTAGSTTQTLTINTPAGTTPGTVEVFLPGFLTATVFDTGDTVRTTTVLQPTGTIQGLVQVLLPGYVTVTTTSGYVGVTTTVALPTGTMPGTVEVIVPSSTVVYCNFNGAATATPDPLATGTASNKGVSYGLWDSPFFDSPPFDENNGFANYNATYFDAAGRSAIHLGKTQRIGTSAGPTTLNQPIYTDTTTSYSTENITLIHRGFLFARTTGTYTFTSINPDDIILFWVGQNAISGFTRGNANLVKTYPAGTTTTSVVLTAGQYIPFRVQWANGGVPSFLGFTIRSPTGAILFDNNGSTDIVTRACDGSTPNFPTWYAADYVTTTVTSGYAPTPSRTTLVTATGTITGTIEVIEPTPIYCTSTTSVGTAPGASATSNVGLQYAVFNSTDINPIVRPADETSGFPNYQVTGYDSQTAVHVGTTNQLGVAKGGIVTIYNDAPNLRYNFDVITIIHRGFIFARQTGTYTFISNYADDITLVWTGAKAQSGFLRSNADLVHTYTDGTQTPRSFSFQMTLGQYLPIRVQYANGNGPGSFSVTLVGPDGGYRIAPNGTMSDIVTKDCYGTTPAFQAYSSAN